MTEQKIMDRLAPTKEELSILREATGYDQLQVLGLVSVIDGILAARAKAAADQAEYERREARGDFVG